MRPGYTVSWSCSSSLSRVSQQVSYPGIFNYTSLGAGRIEATILTPCGNSSVIYKEVWAGILPAPGSIYGFCCDGLELGSNSIYDFYASGFAEATNFEWIVGGGTIIEGQGTNSIRVQTPEVTGLDKKYFNVYVRQENTCGWSSYFNRNGYVASGIGPVYIVITPNPATSETMLQLVDENKKPLTTDIEWTFEIYNSMQSLKEKKTKIKGTQTKLITNGWKEGVYIVRAKIGEDMVSEKLIIKH